AAERESDFQCEHERLGGARENQPPAGQIRRDRLFENLDDVDLVEQEPAEDRPGDDGEQTPKDAPAQLLEMIEKRHLTACSHRGSGRASSRYGLRRCWFCRARSASGERG